MTRTLRPPAALAMLAVIVAGCSNGSAKNGNAGAASSTGTAGGSTAASHNSTATPCEKAVKFAECMRENGYPASTRYSASNALP
jgi:hypothetical protein